MEIIITEWALDSYLELWQKREFSAKDYKEVIRPDVLLLKSFREPAQFDNNKFWSPAEVNGTAIPGTFKMKWHNLGDRKIQLRLPVLLLENDAYLLEAYVKNDAKTEVRKLMKAKGHQEMICRGQYTERGRLS